LDIDIYIFNFGEEAAFDLSIVSGKHLRRISDREAHCSQLTMRRNLSPQGRYKISFSSFLAVLPHINRDFLPLNFSTAATRSAKL